MTLAQSWEANKTKHNEICDSMQPRVRGCRKDDEARHDTRDDVLGKLAAAAGRNCSLLLNMGPQADGSIHPAHAATLREVGKQIRANGWPRAREMTNVESQISNE